MQHVECGKPQPTTQGEGFKPSPGINVRAAGSASEEAGGDHVSHNLPCRISIEIRGIEWYVYNRSAAYESVLSKIANQDLPKTPDSDLSFTKYVSSGTAGGDRPSPNVNFVAHHGNDSEKEPREVQSISNENASATSNNLQGHSETLKLPSLLNVFPISVECSKGAVVMGNQNTRSILVAKFDNAKGHVGARNTRSIDKYQQSIEFDFSHPVIHLKKNQDFKESQIDEGVRHSAIDTGIKTSKFDDIFSALFQWIRTASGSTRGVISFSKRKNSSVRDLTNIAGTPRPSEYNPGVPGQSRWLGLTRYLDDDDGLAEQERWKAIEYGRFPTILESPKLAVNVHWDVPGLVLVPDDNLRQSYPDLSEDINGDIPPDWGVDVRIYGGYIRYGPWADRQRADLQAVFFPTLYKDAVPEKRLLPGEPRVSTVFKLVVEIEEHVTLGIPTREESKDWKWKGREYGQDVANTRRKEKKGNARHKKNKKSEATPESRSCGWLDVKLFPNSTISFTVDLFARSKGFTNQIVLDLPEVEVSSSVNHGLLMRSTSQKIRCDLFYPLKWSGLCSWRVDLQADSPEIFLLRDHIFLLTDLISDWVSGPPSEFHTFVPYNYAINFQLNGFKLYLNANDKNIINNPADTADNFFTMLYGRNLNAALSIPLKTFRPARNQVSFDVKANDGGMEIFSPPWNTYQTFLDDPKIARMDSLRLHGSYEYCTLIKPGLTDILILNLDGSSLKLYLYGFFVRYLLNLKENYFGENLHFRTVEEYQDQRANQDRAENGLLETALHTRVSNDLDVIMAIAIDEPSVKLPTHIYSASEYICLDISSLGLDLRFTNYYMDLAVTLSPICISHIKSSSHLRLAEQHSSINIFIDGVDISSHRLFGLPPAEPTYVCYWDFLVGSITGKCSEEALECLFRMLRSFIFSFQDSENALVCPQAQVIHDLTFLRARIMPIKIGLQIQTTAFLFSSDEIQVHFNDSIGQLFSEHMSISAPSLTMACVTNTGVSVDERSSDSALVPIAYVTTTVDANMVKQKRNFTSNRQLQQNYISLHDGRTHRVPWLIQSPDQPPLLNSSDRLSKYKAPTIPIPPIPQPMPEVNDCVSEFLTTSSRSIPKLTRLTTSRRTHSFLSVSSARQTRAKRNRHDIVSRTKLVNSARGNGQLPILPSARQEQVRNSQGLDIVFFSPWRKPCFPLLETRLDLSAIPSIQHNAPVDVVRYDLDPPGANAMALLGEGLERSSYIIQLPHGLRAFCQAESIFEMGELLLQQQSPDPVTLLDALQIRVTGEQPPTSTRNEGGSTAMELRLWIPYVKIRMINAHPFKGELISQQLNLDFGLQRLLITCRFLESHTGHDAPLTSSGSSLHVSLKEMGCAISSIDQTSTGTKAVIQAVLYDTIFWMASNPALTVNVQLKNLDVMTKAECPDDTASLLQQALEMSHIANECLLKIRKIKKPSMKSLILFLATNGDNIMDPPFLTTASYVLRGAPNHPRTFDSWKMMSRLRYIYQSLPESLKDQANLQCMQENSTCRKDASKRVLRSFEKQRTWDMTHLRQSRLMQEVFGSLRSSVDEHRTSQIPLKVVLTAGKSRFRLDPHISANEVILEQCIFGMTANQPWQESTMSSTVTHMKQSILEIHFGMLNLRLNQSIVQYFKAAFETFKASPLGNSAERHAITSRNAFQATHCLQIAVSLKTVELGLQTINLEAISVFSGLNGSLILHTSQDEENFCNSALIKSGTVTTKLFSDSAPLVMLSLAGSSLYGSMDGPLGGFEGRILNLTGSFAALSLEILEKPPEILDIVDRLIAEEISIYIDLVNMFQSVPDQRSSSDGSSKPQGTLNTYISLSLDLYSINLAILPSLTYSISGQGFQTLLTPARGIASGIAIEFDIKDHSHLIRKRFQDLPDNVSALPISPIYGRFDIRQMSNQNSGDLHANVEEINLDASSVHAFLDAVSHREVANLTTKITQESALLQSRWKKRLPPSPKHPRIARTRKPTKYAGHVSVAGLIIGTNILKSATLFEGAQIRLSTGRIQLKATNRNLEIDRALTVPDAHVTFDGIKIELIQFKHANLDPSGRLGLSLTLKSTSEINNKKELIRTYQVLTGDFVAQIHSQTASILLEIISHLQDTLKTIDVAKEVRGLRKLTRARLHNEFSDPRSNSGDENDQNNMISLLSSNSVYSLKMMQSKIIWKTGPHTSGREVEDLALSVVKIDLASKRDKTARLLIEGFQLQMAPTSGFSTGRPVNSALLPELIFNAAYISTGTDRRLAFQAAGKSVDLFLTTEFILPASDIRRSIASAVADVRKAIISWNASTTQGSSPRKRPLGNKRLASLLVDADFAGATVYIQGRRVSERNSSVQGHLQGGTSSQHGRYGQFTHDNTNSNTTLRTPGIALKFEYKDVGDDKPSLSAEFKVDASSNTLYPTVVPLIMEISSSIKEVVGESDKGAMSAEVESGRPSVPTKLVETKESPTEGPATIFGNRRLNLGLRICRQEFSLSCQPIARVAATANFEAIYITLNTMHSADQEQSFNLSAIINRLQASLQHDYSRESTGSFNVDSIFLSMMSSKHVGVGNGLSAILQSSPIKALINAKQSHDFLLFRDIWAPRKIRHETPTKVKPTSESQAFMVQHYQQVAAAGSFPWDATVSIAKLEIQLDLGQSLGRSTLAVSEIWISSKKTSDWEQNLCIGFQKARVEATGRMSGFIDMQDFRVRTSIHWTSRAQEQSRAPLIQASLGFDRLRIKAAFDFEAFLIADITTSKFLMYNVRTGRQALGDHLVGVLEGEKVQVFCTSTSASQGLALYQAFERLFQEKQAAYESSLKDIEKFLSLKPLVTTSSAIWTEPKKQEGSGSGATAPLQLQTNVFVSLDAISLGAFPSTFNDNQIFKLEALAASARFGAFAENEKLHSSLGMTLGQLRVALSGVSRTTGPKTVGEMSVEEVVASAAKSRDGTILKVPRLVATMQTWQAPHSRRIEYIFGSSFQGKVDVGWNYSRISFLRGMWATHTRALAQRWGKPLPPSALKITSGLQPEGEVGETARKGSGPAKITAVVNVPQSKYQYTALEPPVIETPQLRDMGEATPPLEWIGLQRERLPTLTHQIVIVSLLEVAKEVEDAYGKILGSF